jgi:hypothetical protein
MIAVLRPDDLELLLKSVRSASMDEGAQEARRQVRQSLGISDGVSDGAWAGLLEVPKNFDDELPDGELAPFYESDI